MENSKDTDRLIFSKTLILNLLELGIDYISPADNVVEKQEQNGSVNGNHLKSIVDPYDELIKNHLLNEEKVKVSGIFT